MRLDEYPAQEPLSDVARPYAEGCMARRTATGIEIAYGDDPYQRINLFPAENPDGRVLMFIHGGGWTSGYKEWMDFMAPAFTEAGVTFVTAGYRLAPEHLFPAALDDLADAVVKTMEQVAAHRGDPAQLFVGGHSAGGHYAALLATRDDWWRSRGLGANPVRGCLPVSGVYDFGPDSGLTMRPRFLGPANAATDRAASPIADPDRTPPFLIAYGSRDFPHLMTQADRMEALLRDRGAAPRKVVIADADHFDASHAAGDADGPWVPEALRFMRENS